MNFRGENRAARILMADDDIGDQTLTRRAFEHATLMNEFYTVRDGEELLRFLQHEREYAGSAAPPRPDLILLDLNMPRMDGKTALKRIRANPELRSIPVVILTTSKAEGDVTQSYDLGANSYVTKPVDFDELCEIVQVLERYWFKVVTRAVDRR